MIWVLPARDAEEPVLLESLRVKRVDGVDSSPSRRPKTRNPEGRRRVMSQLKH